MKNIILTILAVSTALLVGPRTAVYAGETLALETRQFSEANGDAINAALVEFNAEEYDRAVSLLQAFLRKADLTAYERATAAQMLGSALYEKDDYLGAVNAFELAIASGGLLPDEASNLRVNIAQLLIGEAQFVQGAQMLEDWHAQGGKLKPAHLETLWQAWMQAEQYDRALPWAEKWFANAAPMQRKHYDLMNFLYHTLDIPDAQTDILLKMSKTWPNDKGVWQALLALYGEQGQNDLAFAAKKQMFAKGFFKSEQELLTLVRYYQFNDAPLEAAQIFEQQMNAGYITDSAQNLFVLAQYWFSARQQNQGIAALDRIAKITDSPSISFRLAEIYLRRGQCDKAGKVLDTLDAGTDLSRQVKVAKLYARMGGC